MYSLQQLRTPAGCASCGTVVTSRLAGHDYQDPMCYPCFEQVAPVLAKALSMQPTSLQLLETRSGVTCAECGDHLSGRRIAGHHLGGAHCASCFGEHAPELACLLFLLEAALRAATGERQAVPLLKVAKVCYRLLRRLKTDPPRAPVKTKKPSS